MAIESVRPLTRRYHQANGLAERDFASWLITGSLVSKRKQQYRHFGLVGSERPTMRMEMIGKPASGTLSRATHEGSSLRLVQP